MKTFALVIYLIFNDGSHQVFIDDSGLSARDCAEELTKSHDAPRVPFKGARKARRVIVACEEEDKA